MWDKIINGTLVDYSNARPRLPRITNAGREQLAAAHWHERLYAPANAPEGKRLSGHTWSGLYGIRSLYSPVYEPIPDPPDPTPAQFPAGIEIGVDGALEIAAQADGTSTWGYVADAEGNLIPYIAHQSPRPDPDETGRRKAEAIAAHANIRDDRAYRAIVAGNNAASSNSVPALRDQVAALAEIIQEMQNPAVPPPPPPQPDPEQPAS